MKMIIYILAHGDTNQESRPKKLDSIMSPDSFFFSLYKVYLPLALHCSCWTFRGMFKKPRKKQWKTEFNTSGVLRTVSSAKIPPIVTDMKIKKVEIEVGDKKHKTRQCKSRP